MVLANGRSMVNLSVAVRLNANCRKDTIEIRVEM